MNRNIQVAALLASLAPAAAMAQSKVEVYGVVDGGLQHVRPADLDGVAQASTTGIESGINYPTLFGLRGSESLGHGLSAIFVLEGGVNLDDGRSGQGGRLFGRQAYLGVQGDFGQAVVGRLAGLTSTAGTFDMFGAADPFGGGFGDPGLSTFAYTAFRVDNGVAYQSKTIGGVRLGAMYSFATSGAEQPGANNNTRYAGLAANYALGKLWTAATYETVQAKTSSGPDSKVLKLAANYDFGAVKPHFAYSKATDVSWLGGPASEANSYLAGLTAPIAGGLLMASYQWLDGKATSTSTGTYAAEREVWSLGYQYDLSKRTFVYGVGSLSRGDKSLGTESSVGTAMASLDARREANRLVLSLGMTHKF